MEEFLDIEDYSADLDGGIMDRLLHLFCKILYFRLKLMIKW